MKQRKQNKKELYPKRVQEILLKELAMRAGTKQLMTGQKLKDIYEQLEFEDSSISPPKYIQSVYLYINGATKDVYDIVLN